MASRASRPLVRSPIDAAASASRSGATPPTRIADLLPPPRGFRPGLRVRRRQAGRGCSVGEVGDDVASAVPWPAFPRPDVVDASSQSVDGGVDVDRLAGGQGIEGLLDAAATLSIAKRADHSVAARGCVSQPCSAAAPPRPTRQGEVDVGDRGVQERLVKAIDGSGVASARRACARSSSPRRAASMAPAGHAKDPDGEGLGRRGRASVASASDQRPSRMRPSAAWASR